MEESGHVAIAKLYMHQREYIVVIRPRAHGLTLHTMFYADEIRSVAEYGQKDGAEPKEQEKKLALQLIESLSAPFEPQKYRDEYRAEPARHDRGQTQGTTGRRGAASAACAGGGFDGGAEKEPGRQASRRSQTGAPVEMKPPMKAVPEAVPARKRAGKRSAG